MGREGVAYTFVSPEEGGELTRIEIRINRLLIRDEIPGFQAFGDPRRGRQCRAWATGRAASTTTCSNRRSRCRCSASRCGGSGGRCRFGVRRFIAALVCRGAAFSVLVHVSLTPGRNADMNGSAIGHQAKPTEKSAVVQGNNQFALDLYGRLSKEQTGENLFFSPAGISVALGMVVAGSRGKTEPKCGVLISAASCRRPMPSIRRLLEQWNAVGHETGLSTPSCKSSLEPERVAHSGQTFGAHAAAIRGRDIAPVDFAAPPEAARVKINRWVEKQTEA